MTKRQSLRLETFLPYRLSIASNRVSDLVAEAYDRLFGLSIPEWRVIAVLGEAAPLTQLAIVRQTVMDKMTVSRAVRPLVERGLVDRTPHSGDKRSSLLSLSDAGRTLYESVGPEALATAKFPALCTTVWTFTTLLFGFGSKVVPVSWAWVLKVPVAFGTSWIVTRILPAGSVLSVATSEGRVQVTTYWFRLQVVFGLLAVMSTWLSTSKIGGRVKLRLSPKPRSGPRFLSLN